MKAYQFQKLLFVGLAATVLMLPMPLGAQSSEMWALLEQQLSLALLQALLHGLLPKPSGSLNSRHQFALLATDNF